MDINDTKTSRNIVIGIGIAFVIIIILQFFSMSNPDPYIQKVKAERAQRDLFLKESSRSPLSDKQKAEFQGVNYFPILADYQVSASFQPNMVSDTIRLATSTQEDRAMLLAGTLNFVLKGKSYSLNVYNYLEERFRAQDTWFLPFTDLSTGKQTYGGGRYLDIVKTNGEVTLDFNQCYHPSCVFNPDYSCPIPPKENHISIEILAGEKLLSQ